MYLYWAHRCFALQSIHEHTYSNVSFSCSSPSTGYCALADLQLTSHLLDFRSSRLHLKGAWSRMSPMTRRSNRANTTNKTRPHSQTKQITAVPALCPGCCRHHNPDKRKHPSSNRTAASASLPHLCMLSSLVQCTPNPKEQWHQGYKNRCQWKGALFSSLENCSSRSPMRHAQPGNNTTQYAEPACAGCGLPARGIVKSSTWRFSCFLWSSRVFPNSQCFVWFFALACTSCLVLGPQGMFHGGTTGTWQTWPRVPTSLKQQSPQIRCKERISMSFLRVLSGRFHLAVSRLYLLAISCLSAPNGLTPHQVFPLFEESCPRRWFS